MSLFVAPLEARVWSALAEINDPEMPIDSMNGTTVESHC